MASARGQTTTPLVRERLRLSNAPTSAAPAERRRRSYREGYRFTPGASSASSAGSVDGESCLARSWWGNASFQLLTSHMKLQSPKRPETRFGSSSYPRSAMPTRSRSTSDGIRLLCIAAARKSMSSGVAPPSANRSVQKRELSDINGITEFAGCLHPQPSVRMVLVVVLEPCCELAQQALGVVEFGEVHLVALERLHEGLGHAVRCGRVGGRRSVSPIPKSRRNPKLIIAERDRIPVAGERGDPFSARHTRRAMRRKMRPSTAPDRERKRSRTTVPARGGAASGNHFFERALSITSFRTSTSIVLRPSKRSSSRTFARSMRASLSGTTTSPAARARSPPSSICRFQENAKLGEMPYLRATAESEFPGFRASSSTRRVCSVVYAQRFPGLR
jgi:hypothetical protein